MAVDRLFECSGYGRLFDDNISNLIAVNVIKELTLRNALNGLITDKNTLYDKN